MVKDLLQLVELDALGARYPSELSGGQQQRVALARALAVQPRVLLLDEPFGALDARVRKQLRQWLRTLHDEVKVTTVLVTHDSEEACEVADRVAVMHEGRIAQIGTAAELGRGAGNPFLESFLGERRRRRSGSTTTRSPTADQLPLGSRRSRIKERGGARFGATVTPQAGSATLGDIFVVGLSAGVPRGGARLWIRGSRRLGNSPSSDAAR